MIGRNLMSEAAYEDPVSTGLFSDQPASNPFYDFMYAAGQNPALATQRGIQYARQQQWNPDQTVQQWNQALGTNFTLDDYYRVTGLTAQDPTFASSAPAMFSNFGESNSWDFGKTAKYNEQNLITAQGNYFERGKDAIVSDELLWNPNSATGKELQDKVAKAKESGQNAGAVVTPYAVFQNKATTQQLLDEVKNSGVDFVVLDPYVGLGVPGVTSEGLISWTRDFINQAKGLGKDVKVVTQGFAQKGKEEEALRHNQLVLSLPGVSEFINFGLEDAKDLKDDPNWVSLGNDYGQVQQNIATAPVNNVNNEPTKSQSVGTPTAERILSEGGGNPVNIDGTIYQPVFDSTGQGETFEQGPLKEIVSYKAGETATGQSYKTYSPDMQEAGTSQFKNVGNFGDLLKTAGEDLAPLAAMALTMGGAGGALGGFLSGGALTGTAASALGNALIAGGSGALTGQDPLKAALLAAGGTFAGGLFGGAEAASAPTLSDAQFVAADAAQLASQGLGVDQIEQVLRASGVNTVTAIAAADAATSGMNVDQIAQDITLGNRGLFTDTMAQPSAPSAVTTSPEGLQTVTTTGATAPAQQIPGLGLDWYADQPLTKLGTALEESSPFFNNVSAPDINAPQVQVQQPEIQQINVTGTAQQPSTPNLGLSWYADQPLTKLGTTLEESSPILNNLGIPELTAPTVPSASDVQQIAVTGTAQPSGFNVNDILATLSPTLFGPAVTNQVVSNMGTQPPAAADQVIDVTGTQQQPTVNDNLASVLPSLVTGIPTVAPPSVSPADQVIEVTQNKQQQPTTIEDLTAAIASLVNPPVVPSANQVIDVTGTKQQQPTTVEDLTAAIASLVNPPVVPSAPVSTPADQVIEITQNKQQQPTTAEDLGATIAASVNAPVVNTPANQVIDVTGTAQPQKNIGDVAAAINAGSLYGPGMTGTQTTVYDKTLETTGSKPIADAAATAAGGLTLADLLKALTTASSLGMLGGGGGGGSGTGTSMVPSTPVPMGNSDYYNAVQRYYNAYMPAAPRDVATPLQQWYEGKFGG
jgi:hypothetical protein